MLFLVVTFVFFKRNVRLTQYLLEYILNISEKAKGKTGFYENTDIFSWALFLPNTDKKLKINKNKIEYCKFKKGLISFTANRVK